MGTSASIFHHLQHPASHSENALSPKAKAKQATAYHHYVDRYILDHPKLPIAGHILRPFCHSPIHMLLASFPTL